MNRTGAVHGANRTAASGTGAADRRGATGRRGAMAGTGAALRARLRGRVIDASDPGYDQTRRVWNGAVDRHPAMIACCRDSADVVTAVSFARAHDLPVAVRAGGHGVAGRAVCDGGLVIDLREISQVRVDPRRRLAVAGAGVLNGEFDAATQRHGLATTAGVVSHTGLAGLTLGGGIGWLARRCGATCDNLSGAQLVTAGGEVVEAADDPDLLWALRGAGANFGVVTRLDLAVHRVGPQVVAGVLAFPAEQAGPVLGTYAALAGAAPRELGTIVNLRYAPPAPWLPPDLHGRPVVLVGVCWTGADAGLDRLLAPLRALRPLADTVGPVPYTEHQRLFDAAVPHGLHYFWRSDYVTGLGGEITEALSQHSWSMRNPRSYTIMFHLGGALADTGPEAAAFSGRHNGFAININAVWAPPEPDDVAWTREQWDRIHGFSAGVYVNFLDDEPAQRTRAAYGTAAYGRLLEVKRRYDPDNVFRSNHNIDPAVRPGPARR
jgi:FAD/FMN-containing dehydrogenase